MTGKVDIDSLDENGNAEFEVERGLAYARISKDPLGVVSSSVPGAVGVVRAAVNKQGLKAIVVDVSKILDTKDLHRVLMKALNENQGKVAIVFTNLILASSEVIDYARSLTVSILVSGVPVVFVDKKTGL